MFQPILTGQGCILSNFGERIMSGMLFTHMLIYCLKRRMYYTQMYVEYVHDVYCAYPKMQVHMHSDLPFHNTTLWLDVNFCSLRL